MIIWQIATGDSGRNYSSIFFDYDVMILGGSKYGDAREYKYHDGIPNSEGSQIHNFTFSPEPGDRVLMRFGKKIIGVGIIPDLENLGYSFEEAFRCVYGWDLCHTRRVIWASNYQLGHLQDVFAKMKQKPSFTAVHEPSIVKLVSAIDDSYFKRDLKDMPQINSAKYTADELGVELFRAGISNKNINDILNALEQAERLCSWYDSDGSGRYPTENEVISHIVLPLFLGLGWSHQQIAVEWNRVDMAFFSRTPTTNEHCAMVLEAKGFGSGLDDVLSQPMGYVSSLNLSNTRYIITTDGANIFVYKRDKDNAWDSNPIAYLSINYLLKEYIIPKKTNPVSSLVLLKPGVL
jgi:hypothetical protein